MTELTNENLRRVVDNALVHLEIGPLGILRSHVNAALLKEGLTMNEVLGLAKQKAAARLLISHEPKRNHLPEAANENISEHEIKMDSLIRGCEVLDCIQQLSLIHAAGMLSSNQSNEIWEKAQTIMNMSGIGSENVVHSPTLTVHRVDTQARKKFAYAINELLTYPLPGLSEGIKRFEDAVRAEFREKEI